MKKFFLFVFLTGFLFESGCFGNFLYESSGVVLVNNSEHQLKIYCYGPYGLEKIVYLRPGQSILSYNLAGFNQKKRIFVANAYSPSGVLIGTATKEEFFYSSYSGSKSDIRKVVFYPSDFRRR
jgi:hypothetical protein